MRRRFHRPAGSCSERGLVLFIVLFATIALAMSTVALVGTAATDVAIGANVEARQHATLVATAALEHAVAALFETGAIADRSVDDPAHLYFAARQAGEDARGVPRVLQRLADYPAGAAPVDVGSAVTLRYIIERLCLLPGSASADNCTLTPPTVAAAAGAPGVSEPPRTPYYRVTARVDGAAGAATFVQALLADDAAHPRRSWRTLDE
jgi:type IV pilus assembly protein PilX